MLNGKVVLITGAKGGLGTHVTNAFLDAGARVVGTSPHIQASNFPRDGFIAEPAAIHTERDAMDLVGRVTTHTGRIDVLVHLVGGFTGGQTVADTEYETLARMFHVNLDPFFFLARAVVPVMRTQGSGAILAIGSRTAAEPVATLGAYSASKAALVSLVRTIALEGKEYGLTANVILPGTMDTPANRSAMPQVDPSKWVRPSQVAAMLVHLASDAASQVTGAVIPIFGGEL
jgi:NAD(P)-dependent dehydrogenase (short-subunit alcohol dehydrogenase family)